MKNTKKIQKLSFIILTISIILVISLEEFFFYDTQLVDVIKKIQLGVVALLIFGNIMILIVNRYKKVNAH